MTDNLRRKQPEDPNTINRNQSWEVEYWAKKLNVSKEKLLEAINAVGPSVAKIRAYLGK